MVAVSDWERTYTPKKTQSRIIDNSHRRAGVEEQEPLLVLTDIVRGYCGIRIDVYPPIQCERVGKLKGVPLEIADQRLPGREDGGRVGQGREGGDWGGLRWSGL